MNLTNNSPKHKKERPKRKTERRVSYYIKTKKSECKQYESVKCKQSGKKIKIKIFKTSRLPRLHNQKIDLVKTTCISFPRSFKYSKFIFK